MYSLEELKLLGLFVLAAILGRLLFYRSLVVEGSFKQRIKVRCLQWLWELPVITTAALIAFEVIMQFELESHSGVMIAVAVGYLGINTLKLWLEGWLDEKFHKKLPSRRKGDDCDDDRE